MGTAGYMSPEQVRGEKLDARTDLFSFGLVLYEMATGQRAFTGETAAILKDAILNHTPASLRELNSTLPRTLEAVVNKALEKDRDLRYQTAVELRTDLITVKQSVDDLRPVKGRLFRHRWKLVSALAVALFTGGIAIIVLRSARAAAMRKLKQNDTIVLADFANQTSEHLFDNVLNFPLRVELAQTPFLNVLGLDKVHGTLKLLNQPEDAKLTPELARQVCLLTNSKVVVAGSIADAGVRYRIALQALECSGGKTLTVVQTEAEERSRVVEMLGVAGHQLRQNLGEPQDSLRKFNAPLQEAMTPSLEALQAYWTTGSGSPTGAGGQNPAGIAGREHAVELDPNFAHAYRALATDYFNLGEGGRAMQNIQKAYALRGRLTYYQRLQVESVYRMILTGELQKAIEYHRVSAQTYSDMRGPARNDIGLILRLAGTVRESCCRRTGSVALDAKWCGPRCKSDGFLYGLESVRGSSGRFR